MCCFSEYSVSLRTCENCPLYINWIKDDIDYNIMHIWKDAAALETPASIARGPESVMLERRRHHEFHFCWSCRFIRSNRRNIGKWRENTARWVLTFSWNGSISGWGSQPPVDESCVLGYRQYSFVTVNYKKVLKLHTN